MSSDPTRSLPPDPDARPEETAAHTSQPNVARVIEALLQPSDTATAGTPSPEETKPASPPATGHEIHIPGYEIEEELGRGAMGVVYKARQTGLNRTVAIKMVISGPYANAATRARFLLEAESVAALEHPHVVRVFAFGEHAGLPFLAMEYLPGGTLAARVKANGPLPAGAATELVAKLASAVAHAHTHGVVHRDIKPGNVLLTAEGEPRLADFGLAKVGRSDLTGTGAILGTPAYMSPEQAAGKVREVGTPADVYALGAVLYDLLTGRPPFLGDTAAVTLQQVLTVEPERPRKLNPSIPRDLETICLKCLAKEPGKRYATAQALADDLNRFLVGEPITARPVGRAERAVKWVKRNKVVAGAMAAVALALLIGSAVAITFGLEANEQAKRATDAAAREKGEADRADKERDDAVAARNDLKQVNDTLERRNDDLNWALASALLAPIRSDARPLLTPHEVNAFWGLASHRDSPVGYRFLQEATRSPLTCKQLANRAESAFQATIGLDPDMRDKANRLLLERLDAPGTPADQQLDIALASARLPGVSPTLAARTATVLVDAMTKTTDVAALRELALALRAAARRMNPETAASICSTAARILTDAMTRTISPFLLAQLSEGLAAVAERMNAEDAARALTDVMAKTTNLAALRSLAVSLGAAAGRMKPEDAARTLTDAMARNTAFPYALEPLARALAAVAERLTPEAAAKACSAAAKILTDAMTRTFDASTLASLAGVLAEVAARMTPEDATSRCSVAGKILTDEMARNTSAYYQMNLLTTGLAEVAARMTPEDAASTCSAIAKILTDRRGKPTDGGVLWRLTDVFAEVAGRMTPEDAARTLTDAITKDPAPAFVMRLALALAKATSQMRPQDAARILSDAMTKAPTNPNGLRGLAVVLAEVTGRLRPEDAASACAAAAKILTDGISRTASPYGLEPLAVGLAAVAERMKPEDAASVCAAAAKILTDAMAKSTNNPGLVSDLTIGLAAVAERMPPENAARLLTDAIARTTNPYMLGLLAKGLGVVTGRMKPEDAARTLTDAMARSRIFPNALEPLARALAAVAERMKPEDAASVCAAAAKILTDAMTRTDASTLASLGVGVAAVAERMKPEDAAGVCAAAAKILTDEMARAASPLLITQLTLGLAEVAGRMEPEAAANACSAATKILTDEMAKPTNANWVKDLARGLAAVAGRMAPEDAGRTLTDALLKTADAAALRSLAGGLAAVAERMRPEDAARTLTDAMAKSTDPHVLDLLAKGLGTVAGRMKAVDAASTYSAAAKSHIDAIVRTKNVVVAKGLAGGLVAVVGRMTPEDAARTLADAIVKTTDAEVLDLLMKGLVAVSGRMKPEDAARTLADATGGLDSRPQSVSIPALRNVVCGFPQLHQERASVLAVGFFAPPSNLLLGLPLMHPQLQPQPKPLPPQQLVDLLKHPFCVGEARRAVLDALEFTYGRKFADQWEFVQYVRDNKLPLDLLTPPTRAQAKP